MLQDLLDRISDGGIDLTIIPISVSTSNSMSDPVFAESIDMMEKMISTEKTLRLIYGAMTKNGYADKAARIKKWWSDATAPADELIGELTKQSPQEADPHEVKLKLAVLNERMRPVLANLSAKIKAMRERQMLAICEVDIDDLLT